MNPKRNGQMPSDNQADRYSANRQRMVEQQLRQRGIRDARVLSAMGEVPRESFVPDALRDEAYEDWPLPIGFGQTISQPYTIAFMLQALILHPDDRVLEIGAGSGYAAAVLSRIVRVVHSIERIPELAQRARESLRELDYNNIQVHLGDGSLGMHDLSPFNAIVSAASAAELPPSYPEQIADGGRIVIPLGDETKQNLFRFTRQGDQLHRENLGAFVFVPLIGEQGWRATDGS